MVTTKHELCSLPYAYTTNHTYVHYLFVYAHVSEELVITGVPYDRLLVTELSQIRPHAVSSNLITIYKIYVNHIQDVYTV
jgi:hypothetical protein